MADLTERAWWTFTLPGSVCHVPANTEDEARAVLRRHSYDKAPVSSWPCVGSRWTSRAALARGR